MKRKLVSQSPSSTGSRAPKYSSWPPTGPRSPGDVGQTGMFRTREQIIGGASGAQNPDSWKCCRIVLADLASCGPILAAAQVESGPRPLLPGWSPPPGFSHSPRLAGVPCGDGSEAPLPPPRVWGPCRGPTGAGVRGRRGGRGPTPGHFSGPASGAKGARTRALRPRLRTDPPFRLPAPA